MELAIGIIMTIVLLVAGVPVAFAFGGSLAYIWYWLWDIVRRCFFPMAFPK